MLLLKQVRPIESTSALTPVVDPGVNPPDRNIPLSQSNGWLYS
jgi:hypothetical protein